MRNITDIKISLIIPTRNRFSLLQNCIRSFFEKATSQSVVEAIMVCDFDDCTVRNMDEIALTNNWNLKMVFQRQSNMIIRDYNNYGSQCSTGKFIWILNDECEMVTKNWDEILCDKCEEFLVDKPDRIVYVKIDDSTHTSWRREDELGCCFPILSREAVD